LSKGGSRHFRFALFGDSICVGQDVAVHRTWAARLSKELEVRLAPEGIRVDLFNASVNGDTTRLALERMAFDIQTRRIDGILIQFGLNDANHWETDRGLPRVSPEAFAANQREIVRRARTFGAKPVMLNTNHPTTRTTAPMPGTELTYEASNQQYNKVIRDVGAADGSLILNDIGAHLAAKAASGALDAKRLVLADGLHLSELGHDEYLEFLTPVVAEAIRMAEWRPNPE
jgi:lysophospholipase L1-like esterase